MFTVIWKSGFALAIDTTSFASACARAKALLDGEEGWLEIGEGGTRHRYRVN